MTDAPERTPLSGRIRQAWREIRIDGTGHLDGDNIADEVAALEHELATERENWDNANAKSLERKTEVERLRAIVEMAWKGYGYDQEWDCDCLVCAAIRTRTPHDTDGGL